MKEFPAFWERENGIEIYEGLTEHIVRTASIGLVLFDKELNYLEKKYRGARNAFVLAAVLHDVGKMNNNVLVQIKEFKERKINKISFSCHELLSAQVTIEALRGYEYVDEVMYATLKHHHAMRLVEDCFPRASKLRLLTTTELNNNSLKFELSKTATKINELMNRKVQPEKSIILSKVYCMKHPALAFALAGFLSLADSAAAYLGRSSPSDSDTESSRESSGKPRGFVRRSLEERGWDLERDKQKLTNEMKSNKNIVLNIVSQYL